MFRNSSTTLECQECDDIIGPYIKLSSKDADGLARLHYKESGHRNILKIDRANFHIPPVSFNGR